MSPATVTEISRGTAHRRQVDSVRASLLRGVEYSGKARRQPLQAVRPGR